MIETKAVFRGKDPKIEATDCVVDKVIRLSGAEFDNFSHNLLREWDFLRDNPIGTVVDEKGRHLCLLVVGEGRCDGILVNTEGASYARYTALLPNAGDTLPVLRYPALADLNAKLERLVDYISGQAADAACIGEHAVLDFEDLEARFDISLGGSMLDTVLDMLAAVPEIDAMEIDKSKLLVYLADTVVELDAGENFTSAQEFAYWQAVTESSRFHWVEDTIYSLNGRGVFYYTGGEDGIYIRIQQNGMLQAGRYEGAIPHIGDAAFFPQVERKYEDFNAAFTAAVDAGGKQFLVDMFSANRPVYTSVEDQSPPGEKPSVLEQIREARKNTAPPSSHKEQKKNADGPEL